MGTKQAADAAEPNDDQERKEKCLEWLLKKDDSETTPLPMDSNVSIARQYATSVDSRRTSVFTKDTVLTAASLGDTTQLSGLLDYLRINDKTLTSPEFTDETTGKTALLKALLNLKDGKNDTIDVLLDIAEQTGDLEDLINASYRDLFYKGQTALHVAIERRSFDHVKLLVQKGADVQAKANGKFFQRHAGLGFYFGELPLSLAACTNQPDIVSFLMDNPHRRADVTDKDSQGNTVLHVLVVVADNTAENTDMITRMYDDILILHNRLEKSKKIQLETIENNQGLTPLKLAAKLGKIGLFKHMLNRELMDEDTRPLSRKFTEWVYGPVHSSLYDLSSIDTNENNCVLEIIIFGSEIPNRPEMLQIEPLRSLLEDKWQRFASKIFLINFLAYLVYLAIFTTVAFYRKDGQPPFPVEDVPLDYLRCVGEIVSVLGSLWFFYKAILVFRKNPPNFTAVTTDGFSEILFFLQAALLLICTVLYFCGRREYVGLLVISLALAWINVLYYTRGFKQMGIYNIIMQRMMLGDLLQFLAVYSVFLFGFSAAIVALMDDSPTNPIKVKNGSLARERSFNFDTFKCEKPSYNDFSFTTLEMFKFTIGMGDLEFTDLVQYKEVFYVLLIFYIVLTYIMLLNLLIAVMGNTVERLSSQSETIWNLQRAFTILDIERTLPKWLKTKLDSGGSKMVSLKNEQDEGQRFFRVEEMNWRQWRSDLGVREEDPGNYMMKPEEEKETRENTWNLDQVLDRIRSRRSFSQQPSISRRSRV
ncbi:transient receptor potential cation channel subfamily V member 1-like [Mugil cephalus]|uniref:transient receptor potential cation channel subfamily V member 1-like n=1 Tax=Mugil cephalus TaxID=48193 RepID=UPI001FB6F52F|nr:transient receptor potential cation channel subfamily V member 1-like [Mugil cephalus]